MTTHKTCLMLLTDSVNTHHTAKLAALVSTTGALLVASLLTSEDKLILSRKIKYKTTGCLSVCVIFVLRDPTVIKSHLLFGFFHMGLPEK